MELKICHLYPEVLNLYGDRGNIECLQRRLKWRGIDCTVDTSGIGEKNDLTQYDLFFIGGGQDFDQEVLIDDLRLKKGPEIRAALEAGKTFLCICGGYQMMGHYYETADGKKCEFLGAIDFYTVGGKKRMIGNYTFRLGEESGGSTVVGFENHSGRTFLGSGVRPLGTILSRQGGSSYENKRRPDGSSENRRRPGGSSENRRRPDSSSENKRRPGGSSENKRRPDGSFENRRRPGGSSENKRRPDSSPENKRRTGGLLTAGQLFTGAGNLGYGNNGRDRTEGVRYKNAFCSYSHGPILPKNPELADFLLQTALTEKYGSCSLEPLQDGFEKLAHDTVLRQMMRGKL